MGSIRAPAFNSVSLQPIGWMMVFLKRASLGWNPATRWSPACWQQAQSCLDSFFIQMSEYLVDHRRIFNAGGEKPATLPTMCVSELSGLQPGRVCRVNTLHPGCGPTAMRLVMDRTFASLRSRH
jgi:hypothetical protein